jgi:hypothetical protein
LASSEFSLRHVLEDGAGMTSAEDNPEYWYSDYQPAPD